MTRLTYNKIRLICFILSVIGFILNSIAYYPGFLSPDSIYQYTQAVTSDYGDWHPPMMAALWNLLIHIYKGPQMMLFFQLFLLWSSFYFLMLLFIKHYTKVWVIVLLFIITPFIQNFAGNIWKDVGMGLSWLLASVIMIKAYYDKRSMTKSEAFISLLLLSYGCWIRVNALPGIIPLVALWLYIMNYTKPNLISRRALVLKTMCLTAAIIMVQIGITKIILKPKKEYPEYKFFLHDLTGIYVKTGELCFPDFIKNYPGFDTVYLKKNYRYSTFDNIIWNIENKDILPVTVNDFQVNELRNYWIKTIRKYPSTYFKNRLNGYLNFLRITSSGSYLIILYQTIDPNEFGFKFEPNILSKYLNIFIYEQRNMPYMKPWFWLILNIFTIVLSFSKKMVKIKNILLALSLSSLFYLLFEFFVFQIDIDFRYFYWNCISLSVTSILIIGEYSKLFLKNKSFSISKEHS